MKKWILVLVLVGVAGAAAPPGPELEDIRTAARLGRVLPGVVGILVHVSGEVTVHCGGKDVYTVRSTPVSENGTGFIIHPDGWIATNGHVVKPVHADDDKHIAQFVAEAVTAACGPALVRLPEKRRQGKLEALRKDPRNRQSVRLTKRLEVYLARVAPSDAAAPGGLPATIKAYSGPIEPDRLPKGGGRPEPPMLDAAILKVEATNLPALRLAPDVSHIYLGQPLFIVGYPGVVLWHDFLSRKSRPEATVTFGRVSSFRLDVNERQIVQTDAAISWGSSGGPVFDSAGAVVALATFISTSLEGDQAIQGFNFLVPIDRIHDMAGRLGLRPSTDSPFNREWALAMNAIEQGRLQDALEHVEAADRLFPNFIDVERTRLRLRAGLRERREP